MPCLRHIVCSLVTALIATPLFADDWPQFRGPNRDGVSTEKGLLQSWPKDGPPLLWSTKGLGGGYSTVSVAKDRIYTLGNRPGKEKKRGELSYLVALNREDGKQLWATEVGAAGGSLGCTPTVDGDLIFALGQMGDLVCVSHEGKRLWSHNLEKEFAGVKGGWNYCESPLVDGDKVLVTPGGKEATVVAFNKKTGETIWKCPIATRHTEAGYSSIVIANVGGIKQYVQLFNGGLVGISTDGKVLWTHEKLGGNTANVPTPIVIGDLIFSAIGYGRGASLIKLKVDGGTVSAEEVYYQRELTNKHGGVIKVGDYVYGDTDDSGHPYCADLKTGKVKWKRKDQGAGRGSAAVTYADGRLYFHYENGTMALVKAIADDYEEVGSFQAPKRNGASWAHPVISDGRLYLREGDYLYCYDVRAKK
jgi:outer membrane protein assembly factor BamB